MSSQVPTTTVPAYGQLPIYSGGMMAQPAAVGAVSEDKPETVPGLFQQTANRRGDAPALHFRAGSRWVAISWADYAKAVSRFANALLQEGVQHGDRVAIWAGNRPEWQIADLGITHTGAVTVAIYPTLAPGQVRYLLAHSQSRVLVLANREQLDQLAQMRDELTELRRVLLLEGEASPAEGWSTTWDSYLRAGEAYGRTRPGQLLDRWQAVTPRDMASLIYTSGTTRVPKAAILTHRNLTWTVAATMLAHFGSQEDRLISYLPLAHVLERVVSHMRQLQTGCEVYFSPAVDQVAAVAREVRPTYLTSVPRLWEKMYAGVRARMDEVRGPRRLVRDFALRAGAARTRAYERRRAPSFLLRRRWAIADRLGAGRRVAARRRRRGPGRRVPADHRSQEGPLQDLRRQIRRPRSDRERTQRQARHRPGRRARRRAPLRGGAGHPRSRRARGRERAERPGGPAPGRGCDP